MRYKVVFSRKAEENMKDLIRDKNSISIIKKWITNYLSKNPYAPNTTECNVLDSYRMITVSGHDFYYVITGGNISIVTVTRVKR